MKDLSNIKKIHFIGIGGISMSALAKYSLCCMKKVSGSDKSDSDTVLELVKLGALIKIPSSDIESIKPDLVVYSSAIGEENLEILTAKRLNIPIIKRSEFLGLILQEFKKSICVCGCHGKTTVTAMLTHVFMRDKSVPTAFIGGNDSQFKNFFFGEKDLVIAEACEYKKNFLDMFPNTVVCTNIDLDHLDSYCGIQDIIKTFETFMKNRQTVVNADDLFSGTLLKTASISFGIKKGNVRATKIIPTVSGNSFSVLYNGKDLGRVEINQKGLFNIYNALAVIACAILYKIDFILIKEALEEFSGVERRMEYLGDLGKSLAFADYAHHPKEIRETLTAFCDNKTLVVFQPHTYSRTKGLMENFSRSLFLPKKVIIYKTYPAREEYDEKGDAVTLYKRLKKDRRSVYYCDNEYKLLSLIKKKGRRFNKIIFIGAGDIYNIAKNIIKKENKTGQI